MSGFDDKYKIHSLSFPGSQANPNLIFHGLLIVMGKPTEKRIPWYSETPLDIDCLSVSQ